MKLTDREISLWIAEKLGWKLEVAKSGNFWHHPDCVQPQGHKECGRSELDMVNDSAMTVMLMEKMREPDLWLESNPGEPKLWGCTTNINCQNGEDPPVAFSFKLGHAVAEAFMLANGWKEKP